MARRSGKGSQSLGPLPPGTLAPDRVLEGLRALQNLSILVRQLEDRRQFHPSRSLRPAGAMSRAARSLVEPAAVGSRTPGLKFADPEKVSRCVRRKDRREVLFAKRLTRKGAGASHRRRNWFSAIGC